MMYSIWKKSITNNSITSLLQYNTHKICACEIHMCSFSLCIKCFLNYNSMEKYKRPLKGRKIFRKFKNLVIVFTYAHTRSHKLTHTKTRKSRISKLDAIFGSTSIVKGYSCFGNRERVRERGRERERERER